MKKPEPKPLGVIDALAGGFELVLLRPWIVLLPIALDLFVWLGPQIGAKPLFQKMIDLFGSAAALPPDAPAETLQSIQVIKDMMQNAGDTVNLVGLIALYCLIAAGFPTVFGVQPPSADWTRAVGFTVPNSLAFFALLVPLGLAGILLTTLYLELIARAVRKETDIKTFLPQLARALWMTALLTALVVFGWMAFTLPLSLGAAVTMEVSQGLASFVVLLATLVILWATLYLAFVLPSIFVSGSGVRQAILNSVNIFRFDFRSAISLIVLIYLIRWGFSIVWDWLVGYPWGALFDVVANAVIGSGLVAALMLFYSDRITWLNQLRERIRQQQIQLKGQ